jgi:hypothetical protein
MRGRVLAMIAGLSPDNIEMIERSGSGGRFTAGAPTGRARKGRVRNEGRSPFPGKF